MKLVWLYSMVSVFLISLTSFFGLFAFGMKPERLKTLLIYFVAFAAGALFGDAFFHMIPEIVRTQGFGFYVSLSFLGGIVLFLVIEKIIHLLQYHSHGAEAHSQELTGRLRPFVFINVIGDGIHNFGDGLIIGTGYLVGIPLGVATAFAVVFHEIPHELGNYSVLVHGGLSRGRALFVNFLTALLAVVGVVVALVLRDYVEGAQHFILPIVAGGFVYIAGSNLIPELNKESVNLKEVLLQLAVFILGIALMALMLLME